MIKKINFLLIFPCLLSMSKSTSPNFLKSFNGLMPNSQILSIIYSSAKEKVMLTNNNSQLGKALYYVDIVKSTATGPYINKGTAYTVFYSVLLSLNSSCTYKNGLGSWFVSNTPHTRVESAQVTTSVSKYSTDSLIYGPELMKEEKNDTEAYFVTKGEEDIFNSTSFVYTGEFKGTLDVTKNNYGYYIPYYKKYYEKSYKGYLESYNLIDYICKPSFTIKNSNDGFMIDGTYSFKTEMYTSNDVNEVYISQDSVGIEKNANTRINKDVWLYGYFSLPALYDDFDIKINAKSNILVGSGSFCDDFSYKLDETYNFSVRL